MVFNLQKYYKLGLIRVVFWLVTVEDSWRKYSEFYLEFEYVPSHYEAPSLIARPSSLGP